MFLGCPGQHRILGRSYNDEQLFRVIVPRRFTLRRHHCDAPTMAGFSNTAFVLNTDKRPQFSDADIAFALRYRWPDQFAELKVADIANIDVSVRGGGAHLKSGVDPLEFDDPTLSEYCHDTLYNNPARRAEILNAFKKELDDARRCRTTRVEELFKDFETRILEYIFVARIYMAMSWKKIALSLERRREKPPVFLGEQSELSGSMVKEIYQMHSEARTSIFDECVNNKDSMQKVLAAMPIEEQQEHERRSKLSTNKAAVLRKVLSKEPLECHLSPTRPGSCIKRQTSLPITQALKPTKNAQPQRSDGFTVLHVFD